MFAISTSDLRWTPGHPAPVPGPHEVLIQVHAAGVNRADLVQRAGRYPPPPGASPLLGLEVSGTVLQDAGPWSPGDRVCALLSGGGYAEQVAVAHTQVLPLPPHLSFAEGAALPEAFATAWLNLVQLAALQPGERVLLHAGASGVGTAALQVVRALGGRAFVTVGGEDKLNACLSLGAEAGWIRHQGPWLPAVKAWAGGADIILDPVGGGYLEQNQRALALDGRLLLIGLLGGRHGQIDLGRLLMKRQRLWGSTLRARSVEEKGALVAALRAELWPQLVSREIQPVLCRSLPITQAARAHALLQANQTLGKVVLTLPVPSDTLPMG